LLYGFLREVLIEEVEASLESPAKLYEVERALIPGDQF